MENEVKLCPECGEKLKGRADKKFCSDACRNAFNNKINSDTNSIVRNINNQLRKNRRILESFINEDGKARVGIKKLTQLGFNFEYITSIYKTKTGNEYFFCYEYGYMKLENELYMIVKREKN